MSDAQTGYRGLLLRGGGGEEEHYNNLKKYLNDNSNLGRGGGKEK